MVNLSGANLTRADLSNVNLKRADLSNANLTRTDLSSATLEGATFVEADLEGVLLVGVQLKNSKGLTDNMLEKAFGDENTSLPNGLTRPANWESREKAIEQWQAFYEEERRRFRQSMGFNDD